MEATANTSTDSTGRIVIREASPADAGACGRIFFEAFESIATRHNLPIEAGTPEFAHFKAGELLNAEGIAALVAERDGEVLGSAFVDERAVIAGIGPVSVDPSAQDDGIGRALMEVVLRRERERGASGVRLVQTAYHYRSLALYAKLGFAVREPLTVVQGEPPAFGVPGIGVRPARSDDVEACGELCARIHGHDRNGELREAIAAGSAVVAQRPSRISGYATGFGYGWHAVAATNEDLFALLGSAEAYVGLGVLVPSRNAELLDWCLDHGLRIVQQSTLMTIGFYNEPTCPYLPSIVY